MVEMSQQRRLHNAPDAEATRTMAGGFLLAAGTVRNWYRRQAAPELYPSEWNLAYFSFWSTKPGRDAARHVAPVDPHSTISGGLHAGYRTRKSGWRSGGHRLSAGRCVGF